jgi:hypothetical protein
LTYDINLLEKIEDEKIYDDIIKYLNELSGIHSIPNLFGVTDDYFAKWLIKNKYYLKQLL